ncbi:ArsB/NhaD family transporter, partial [Staphylococcus epidermidis]|uniref:ArsB/NhaD family transporter n=1 Tax=Staphylococcus epidermidis TaxID=1282 RepID=UPI0028CB9553
MKPPPSNILLFSIPIYLLLFPLKNLPITPLLPNILSTISNYPLFTTLIAIPFISPFLSPIINNIPTLLIHPIPIAQSPTTPLIKQPIIYPNIIRPH